MNDIIFIPEKILFMNCIDGILLPVILMGKRQIVYTCSYIVNLIALILARELFC